MRLFRNYTPKVYRAHTREEVITQFNRQEDKVWYPFGEIRTANEYQIRKEIKYVLAVNFQRTRRTEGKKRTEWTAYVYEFPVKHLRFFRLNVIQSRYNFRLERYTYFVKDIPKTREELLMKWWLGLDKNERDYQIKDYEEDSNQPVGFIITKALKLLDKLYEASIV